MHELEKENLRTWISKYNIKNEISKVAIIMAGNFPLAGLHDLICVIISGNQGIIKPASDDKILINFFVEFLHKKFPETKNLITTTSDKLGDFDKVIATGSNNTFNYFEYYFRNKSTLLRKNRTSVAVISGNESQTDLELLSDDIFMYFGLGCRNVSKLFIPEGYDLNILKEKFKKYNHIVNHNKFYNNYNYQKIINTMNGELFIDGDYFLMKQSKEYAPPISVIYYDFYNEILEVQEAVKVNKNQIQCIVTNLQIENSIKFGEAQKPKLYQYADDIDTLDFLLTSS
tara:strand:- start:1801 stop:2658 length:858 start_codon:yes stop_codon:yes gene_type:complete